MRNRPKNVQIGCREVWRELVHYMEDDLSAEMRRRIEQHLRECAHCTAIYDGTRNVVQLLGSERALELPPGLSRRVYRQFLSKIQ